MLLQWHDIGLPGERRNRAPRRGKKMGKNCGRRRERGGRENVTRNCPERRRSRDGNVESLVGNDSEKEGKNN